MLDGAPRPTNSIDPSAGVGELFQQTRASGGPTNALTPLTEIAQMKKLIFLAIISLLAWKGYGRYQQHDLGPSQLTAEGKQFFAPASQTPTTTAQFASFSCDGRTRCTQMTSCAEATFFIQKCPNTKMDGDNDGIPCERQWCH